MAIEKISHDPVEQIAPGAVADTLQVVPVAGDSWAEPVKPRKNSREQAGGKLTGEFASDVERYENLPEPEEEEIPWINGNQSSMFFGGFIALNAVVIGLETDLREGESNPPDPSTWTSEHWVWYSIDCFFVILFLGEMFARMAAERSRYFCQGWNIFDFSVLMPNAADTLILTWVLSDGGSDMLSILALLRVLRLLRLARLLRLFRMFKDLWVLVKGVVKSIQALSWVGILSFVVIYMIAVLLTKQVGQPFGCKMNPGDPLCEEIDYYHGTIFRSIYTLFVVMTGDGWSDHANRAGEKAPWTIILFIAYFLLANLALLNLVTGIMVDSLAAAQDEETKRVAMMMELKREDEHRAFRELFELADKDGSGTLDRKEFRQMMKNPKMVEELQSMDIFMGLATDDLFDIFDINNNGSLDGEEFIEGLQRVKDSAKGRHILAVQHDVQFFGKKVDSVQEDVKAMRQLILDLAGQGQPLSPKEREANAPHAAFENTRREMRTLEDENRALRAKVEEYRQIFDKEYVKHKTAPAGQR